MQPPAASTTTPGAASMRPCSDPSQVGSASAGPAAAHPTTRPTARAMFTASVMNADTSGCGLLQAVGWFSSAPPGLDGGPVDAPEYRILLAEDVAPPVSRSLGFSSPAAKPLT